MERLSNGISALIRIGASVELDSGLETLSIGPVENSPGDWEMLTAGRHLLYKIAILDGQVHVFASLLDSTSEPEHLLRVPDVASGWLAVFNFITSVEKFEVRSLVRPIVIGNPTFDPPAECWIVA